MDPVLQIDPERCVLVMGPQLAAAALSLSEGVPAALSYAMLIDIGVQKMLEVEARKSVEERSRKHSLLVNAYELEPAFAACKVVESLREHGVYQQWLNNLFGSLLSLPTQKRVGGLVDRLLSLQERGALLVYTYYDTILDVALKTSPIFLGDKEAVRGWASYQKIGLLHVHGVYSQPDSVCCDCVNYKKLVGEAPGGHILKEVCRNRSVIFIGFDGEFYDPFISKFARTFLCPSHPPPLLLSSLAAKLPSLDTFLMLKVSQLANLDQIFLLSSPMSQLGERNCQGNNAAILSRELNDMNLCNIKNTCPVGTNTPNVQ